MKVPLVLLVSEAVPVFVQSLKVRFQKRKYFLSIPCIHARRPQTGYEALLLLHKASRFGDVLLNTVKVIFEAHSRPHDPLGIAAFELRAHHTVPDWCLIDAAIGYFY